MLITRLAIGGLTAGIAMLCAGLACGQNYPMKPVRILTAEPGGGLDFQARLIAQGLSGYLGKQVIVENHGGGVFAAEIVAKAPADGYSLLFYGSNVWLAPFLSSNVPWDPEKDFAPVAMAVRSPNLVVVHPSLPVKSVHELIVLAKARPGELNYASGSAGSSPHLAAELFKFMAGVNIVRIPYRGNALGYTDVIRGQVQLIFPTASSVAPHLQSRRLRPLAVTTAQPSALFPDLPTVAASGLPGYELATITGMFAPAGTPAALISRLNREIVRVLASPEVKERFFKVGVEAAGSTPQEFAATIKSEMSRLGKVIRDAGIRDE
jgi:tripartite-type tricarboxylate transporter receptor subunit TctC